jgi:D-tyrosyl-tRNA(Tyr) deacylase
MIGLLQRVQAAGVSIAGQSVADIGPGLLVLVGVQRGDTGREVARLLERLLGYRVFPDSSGKMNLAISDTGGELLLVPQFTLAADTRKGMRPGFSPAAAPADGARLFERLVTLAQQQHGRVACGQFGADMQVALVNDGPVTFWLEVTPRQRGQAGQT